MTLIKVPSFDIIYSDAICKERKYKESEGLTTDDLYYTVGADNSALDLEDTLGGVYETVLKIDTIYEIAPVHIPKFSPEKIAVIMQHGNTPILIACEFNKFLKNLKNGEYLFMHIPE